MAASPLPLASHPTPRPAYTPVPSLLACSFPIILSALAKSHLSSGLLSRFWSSWAIPAKATVPQPGKVNLGLRDTPPPQGGDGRRRDGGGVQGRPCGADQAADSLGSAADPESRRLLPAWTASNQETWAVPNQLLLLLSKPSCNYHTGVVPALRETGSKDQAETSSLPARLGCFPSRALSTSHC